MKKPVVQGHHLIYAVPEHGQKDVEVRIYKGEHFLATNLNRRVNISKGFIKYLRVWLALNEDKGVDL